jgi:hypothetical protein
MAPDIADTIWLCGHQIHIYIKSTNIVTADECRGNFETPVSALCPAYAISCDVLVGGCVDTVQISQLCNCDFSEEHPTDTHVFIENFVLLRVVMKKLLIEWFGL